MFVGINYPWHDYGWDFGDPPPTWVAPASATAWREQKRGQIRRELASLASLGLSGVRWFLLCDGTSYGYGDEAPRLIDGRWRANPLPAGHHFYAQLADDFTWLLGTLAELNLKLVPSFIDFHWCYPGTALTDGSGIVKGGRAEIVADAGKREQFLDLALEPLLEISGRSPETIYAWELMNEPEWVTQKRRFLFFSDRRDPQRTVPLKAMRGFLASGIERINRRRLPNGNQMFQSTVGFAQGETLTAWHSARLGISLHQFHYYAQGASNLPAPPFGAQQPCVVGEFATAAERDWPELIQTARPQTISNRLRLIEEKGYDAAFLWSARASDQATQWQEAEINETLAYHQAATAGNVTA